MSFVHGKNAFAMIGALNMSPYLNSLDLSVDGETADTTCFQATWKTAIAGTVGAKLDFGGLYDPDAWDPGALSPGPLTYAPGGASTIGDRARLLNVIETSYAKSVPVGGVIAVKGTFTADNAVGFGDVLHTYSTDTDTTTGADKNDGAGTTSGWIAHLHVGYVSAGSWVVKLQDAATNDWADVTGGTFTAVTGVTSQRLLSAASTTALRRHVRYVATRTGGAGTDIIVFFLAYARNR